MPRRRHASPHVSPLGRTLRFAVWAVLILMAIGVLYPLFWMVSSSFKTSSEIFSDPWALPTSLSVESFLTAWSQGVFGYFLNSTIITVVSLVLVLLLSTAAAFALTKLRLPFAGLISLLILGGLMVSPTMILVPVFQLMIALHLHDTLIGLILVYVAYRLPFTIFLIRAYMLTLPNEVIEASMIDGASLMQTFSRIVIPLCKPVLVSAGLVYVLFAWNEFPFALILLNDPTLKTLPVGLLDFKSALQTDWSVLFAGLTLAAVPMIALFVASQRAFVRGLADGMGK
ncbi:ABC-type sugar transport system, permease component [Brachybacterium faecium DSM 4810]|uniref:ABC-type sugar transport system, permease component n=1 Tax=Brachybacterium faecium (strain ATCC 43885 / DSM 4810 / JCM 11609 / LMG 19847 / NBRC 14762 / NCIMB 9860 / 6-10) TaxID=446465 RepID=C7MHM1_BRAFD|nr:ABC-type sugar transport system, permease component [Brachybacterium faecium DSM 4810]